MLKKYKYKKLQFELTSYLMGIEGVNSNLGNDYLSGEFMQIKGMIGNITDG